ncbi:hypothetical protein N7478_007595 [Penicillium angulare]|uniref:uncharacterized protein n=1 Tax=Penicillium angulare TaxID=116970 RepID=UPI00254248AF|nr:uncharacterized protein N7478_007595 [Penicillium angulare]KAJ5272470.1 hypothetical protein N7478_007595 [Penicillium angulare]
MSSAAQAKASEASWFRSILGVVNGVYCNDVDCRCVRIKLTKSEGGKEREICTSGKQYRFDHLNKIKRLLSHLSILLHSAEPENDAALLAALSELAEIFLCPTHIKTLGTYVKYQWFYELRDPETVALILSILDSHPSPPITPEARSDKSNSISPFSSPLTPPETPAFDPHTSASRSPTKAASKTEEVVVKRLGNTDQAPGFFYVGFHPAHRGMFHVGYTERDTKTGRFPEHEICYPGIIWLTEKEGLSEKVIQYAHRLEQIILNIFARERRSLRNSCRKCQKVHGEWLEVEKTVLLDAVTEWSAYVQEAYDEKGHFHSNVKMPSLYPRTRASREELEPELVTPCQKPSVRETLILPPTPPESPDTMPGSFIEDPFDRYDDEGSPQKSKGIFNFDNVKRVLFRKGD